MRELKSEELVEVSGGVNPILLPLVVFQLPPIK